MTCQEFRDHNATEEHLFRMTTAERAACVKHYCGCDDCQQWINDLPGVTASEFHRVSGRLLEIMDKDRADPEGCR